MRCFVRLVATAAACLLITSSAPAAPAIDAPVPFGPAGPLPTDRAALLVGYAIVIALASMGGGAILRVIRLTHTRMQVMMSGVGGLMLGIGIFQLLPHAVEESGSLDVAIYSLAAGLVFMFLLIRAFHFHVHDAAVEEPHAHPHGPACSHDHHHDAGPTAHELSWVGVALGLAIHTLIDGVALGAAIESAHSSVGWLAGFGTFAAIALHKPLDALSIGSVMTAAGRSPALRTAVNVGFSLMCPLGAAVFLFGVRQFSETQHLITGIALGFSAGAFLCIALGDLLPELEFHSHDRGKLSVALLAGLAFAFVIERFGHGEVHIHRGDASREMPSPGRGGDQTSEGNPVAMKASEQPGFLNLDFVRFFPHKFWVSGWGRDDSYPDGFRYKALSARDEQNAVVEFVLVLEEEDGTKQEMHRAQVGLGDVDRYGRTFVSELEKEHGVDFEEQDLSHVRTAETFERAGADYGWSGEEPGSAAGATPD